MPRQWLSVGTNWSKAGRRTSDMMAVTTELASQPQAKLI